MNFIPVAIAYAIGVYLSDYVETALLPAVLAFCMLLLYLLRRLIRKPLSFTPVVVAFIVAFAACNAVLARNFAFSPIHGFYDSNAEITGVVCDMPYQNGDITRYIVYTNQITADTTTTPVKLKILVNSNASFKCGDKVKIYGQIKKLRAKNGKFDMNSAKYYGSRGIQARINAKTMFKTAAPVHCYLPQYAVNLIRSHIADTIYRYDKGDYAHALVAVTTGNKNNFSEEYDRILHRTGMKHLYYPVFVHIMLISSFVALFKYKIKKRSRDLMLCCLLAGYLLFNSANPVALKNSAIIALAALCRIKFGTYSLSDITAFVVLCIGIFNPLMLFDSGLVISVSAMIVLNCFLSLNSSKKRLVRILWRSFLLIVINFPIIAYFFHQVYLYSFLASFIFIPINMVVLLLSPLYFINCLFGTPYPMAYLIRICVTIMLKLPYLVDKLPLKNVAFSVSIPFMAAWYSAAAMLYYRRKKKPMRAHVCTAVSAALFLSCAVGAVRDSKELQIHIINVGQGDAAMIRRPYSGNIILIDGGGAPPYSDYNIGEHVFLPYLYGEGVNLVQAAFVSHYHKDHVEGIIAALKNIRVYHLFMPDVLPDNEYRKQLEEAAAKQDTKIHYISEDSSFRIGDIRVKITVPHEYTRISKDENNTSLMIELQYGKFNALFTGDMTRLAEHNLLQYGDVPQADVLKLAHHGSKSANSQAMLERINPKFTAIGVGENNTYHFPSEEVLRRLDGRAVFRTDLNGDIVFCAAKNGAVRAKNYQ